MLALVSGGGVTFETVGGLAFAGGALGVSSFLLRQSPTFQSSVHITVSSFWALVYAGIGYPNLRDGLTGEVRSVHLVMLLIGALLPLCFFVSVRIWELRRVARNPA